MRTSLALLLALLMTGCATTGRAPLTPEQKSARLQTVAETAAYAGTAIWLSKHPGDRAAFATAQSALSALMAGDNATPEQLTAALDGLPIKELKGEQGAIYVGVAMILYDAYLRENVSIDGNVNVKAVVTGIHSGLSRALATQTAQP